MVRVLYITSSSYSGSTFLSFLLNTHSQIATVGEMEGWKTANLETFPCSCGSLLKSCPFFAQIAAAFKQEGVPFSLNDFGTGYRIVGSNRLNRYLLEALPYLRRTSLEKLRDAMVQHVPVLSKRIAASDRATLLFMGTVLSLAEATVFVDADKSPFKLRLLRRIPELELRVLYLVRDIRGVALTFMENRRWSAELAARIWITEQLDILRIMNEFPWRMQIHYEDLCDDVNDVLGRIHGFAGVSQEIFGGDFRSAEHHILGNSMRLDPTGKIVKSERWKRKLTRTDIASIETTARAFMRRNQDSPLSGILKRYLDS